MIFWIRGKTFLTLGINLKENEADKKKVAVRYRRRGRRNFHGLRNEVESQEGFYRFTFFVCKDLFLVNICGCYSGELLGVGFMNRIYLPSLYHLRHSG